MHILANKLIIAFISVSKFFIGISEVDAIECWQCNSLVDYGCSDPFDNTTVSMVDCTALSDSLHLPSIQSHMCRKLRQKVNGIWTVWRDCAKLGTISDERYCQHYFGSAHIYVEDCLCQSRDGCNEAAAFFISAFTLVTTSTIGVLIGRCFL